MFDYLAFVYAGIAETSGNAFNDGSSMANECLTKLDTIDNKQRFPPRLLILLASPEYLHKQKAEQLLKGVNSTFGESYKDIDVIGSSVGGVFFDRRIHPNGALLVCLASKLIEARVGSGTNARQNPKGAIDELLNKLELDPSRQIDPNPLANRLIITFMPGCNRNANNGAVFPAPDLHRLLYEGVQARISLIGGLSSANHRSLKIDGLQFAKGQVLRDSIVAASIITGVPIGVSLNDDLIKTNRVLCVTKLGKDKRTILEFNGKGPMCQLDVEKGYIMLGKLSADDERTIDIPLPLVDGSVQLLRPLKRNDYFQVFRPGSKVVKTALNGINQAKRRVYVERPVASLLFPCNAYNPRHKRAIVDVESALSRIEESLREKPCVGGFFDGEIGVDEKGRSRLTNGGVGYVIFGDEIRERTPLYKGVSALADYGHKLLAGPVLTPASIYETIRNALDIVSETGFPGAMLSLIVSNLDRRLRKNKQFIIAREAVGVRFAKVKEHTKRSFNGKDILALVARNKEPCFVPDSRKDRSCNRDATRLSGIISQYVLPLKRLDKTVFGTLQVDVGDLHHLSPDVFRKTEKARILDCFAEVFSASINRIANAVENKITLDLDKALEESLSAGSIHEGVGKFFNAAGRAFGVEMGHLRLVKSGGKEKYQRNQTLVLETGFGACYEAEKGGKRREINANDFSPICCAFHAKVPHIVNDLDKDSAFNAMLKSVSNDLELFTPLSRTKSYAAVAFRNERGSQIGALSFGSSEPWFFLELHRAALEALAERLGFLIQHLKAKIARDFLLAVSPKLAERNLDHAQAILRNVTEVFRTTLNADVASLYLWDPDRKKYVLRAQSNWDDGRWEHAASYDANTGWIGVKAINKDPLYVPDLRKYYDDEGYDCPQGRYARYMFGQELSDTFTVEAIGLPLRIGPKVTDKFGVLTLYRRIEKGHASGFAITDIQLLQEGGYNVAGLVNAVLRHRDVMWEQQEEHRRQEFYHAMNSTEAEELGSFGRKVCWHVLKSFRAIKADFYQVNKIGSFWRHSWISGASRNPQTKMIVAMKELSPDSSVQEAVLNCKVIVGRKQESLEQAANPVAMKTAEMVERACIPIVGAGRLLGILAVDWSIPPEMAFSLEVQHDKGQLQKLGQIIGSVCVRNQVVREREQSNLALQATAAYAFQRAHLLRNTIHQIRGRSRDVANGKAAIDVLIPHIKVAMKIVKETTFLGQRVLYPSYHRCLLSWLINETFEEQAGTLKKKFAKLGIAIPPPILGDYFVKVDPSHTKDALFNLIDNAANAIDRKKRWRRSEKPTITISAVSVDDLKTKLLISDNGIGMTAKEKHNALRGFVRAKDHEGVGVLISYVLLTAQGGSLEFESVKFVGTDTVVILPTAEME